MSRHFFSRMLGEFRHKTHAALILFVMLATSFAFIGELSFGGVTTNAADAAVNSGCGFGPAPNLQAEEAVCFALNGAPSKGYPRPIGCAPVSPAYGCPSGGLPYNKAGRFGPGQYDCSGFVYEAYLMGAGFSMGNDNVSQTEVNIGPRIPESQMEQGDLVFYNGSSPTHVGMYIGDGWVAQALDTPHGVGVWGLSEGGSISAITRPTLDTGILANPTALDGNRVIAGMTVGGDPAGGYWVLKTDGAIYSYGDAKYYGSNLINNSNSNPAVGIARTTDGHGYWIAFQGGQIYGYGDAGKAVGATTKGNKPTVAVKINSGAKIVGIAAYGTKGLWILGANGDVHLLNGKNAACRQINTAVGSKSIAIAATADEKGYWISNSNGGTTSCGSAQPLHNDAAHSGVHGWIVGLAGYKNGGAWQVNTNGGVYSSGTATSQFHGTLNIGADPTVGIATGANSNGYYLYDWIGHIYNFGEVRLYGSPTPDN